MCKHAITLLFLTVTSVTLLTAQITLPPSGDNAGAGFIVPRGFVARCG